MSGLAELPIAGTRISKCSACETPLPLCDAPDSQDIRVWQCSGCGAEYKAVLAPNYSIVELRGVRPESVIFDPQSLRRVDPEMLEFAHRIGATDNHRVEKRSSTRHAVIATLAAREFDDRLRPVGPPFQAVCRNLSASGICLINSRAIQSDFLVLELPATGGVLIQTLAHILRRRPLGPYHDIGIEFLTKFAARTPSS